MSELELWGGIECTVNRVGDAYRDQLRLSGHQFRVADIERIAATGIRAIRYPLLWERVAPDHPEQRDWSWVDGRLNCLQQCRVRVIAGLLHHGSGPRYTNLLDDNFAYGLAQHARAAAERYSWIEDWTPLNEPVTTARFSALYGHWYPHRRDERSFWLALLNQIDGVRLAMREIRKLVPHARLIQTDDLGRTWATSALRDQAAFDNQRRWMGWDLLAGKVTREHPFWARLAGFGFADRLQAIADDPCPPDIVGVNHYLTSDRFLDHRTRRYPPALSGGNARQQFVDTEAVRVLQPPPPGIAGVLREAWERYRTPIAVTEVHNGCTREEQMRWTQAAWNAALDVRAEGVDVRAVTAWALLGSHDWNTLLTAPGRYEPGAWDISGPSPRPTAMFELLRALPRCEASHPVLAGAGWWQRTLRLHHPGVQRPASMQHHLQPAARNAPTRAPLLITGATGTLGGALAAACRHRGLAFVSTTRAELDLAEGDSIEKTLDLHRPWAVINAAGWVRVDEAEESETACMAANAQGPLSLARACAARGIPCVNFSSDLVFGASGACALAETSAPAPLNAYGRSKLALEQGLAELGSAQLLIRTAAFFSPYDAHNFAVQVVRALVEGERFVAAGDAVISPTYVPDLCDAVLDLVIDRAEGIWHLTNGEALSWAAFARQIAAACGLDCDRVEEVPAASLAWHAPRPAFSALVSERALLMQPLDAVVARFAQVMRERNLLRSVEVA